MPELIRASKQDVRGASESVWVPVGEQDRTQIITSTRRNRSVTLSRQLIISSPLYSRLISAILDNVFPPGVQLVVPDMETQPQSQEIDLSGTPIVGRERQELRRIISWMWNNGPSAIARNARVLLTTLLVDGELILVPRVNESDGRVTLTQKQPDNINELKIGEGVGRVQAITFMDDDKEYKVIAEDVDGITLTGDIFYYRSRYSGHSITHRGIPLLAPVLDEVAALTEFVYKRLSKLAELSSYYWDVTISGASQESVDEFLESPKSVPPEAGEVMAHNEQVQWDFVSTDFSSMSDELDTHINHLAGAAGLTPEFVGHSPGRDVSTESLFSAIAHLTTLRDDAFSIIAELVRYQLQQAKRHNGAIRSMPDFKLVAEEIGSRSMQRAAQAFIRYADGLAKAKQENLISEEEASNVLRMLLIRLGLISEEDIPSKYDSPVWRSR